MTRRRFLAAAAAPVSRRPNVVLIMADDLGSADLSSYRAPDITTPNIDSIGHAGVRFTRSYASAPECTPTRAALMTGRYPQRVGGLECAIGTGNVGRYDEAEWLASRRELGLPASETSVAAMLRGAGYATCLSGKWHLGYEPKFSPNRHGFEEALYIEGGGADYFTRRENTSRYCLLRNGKRTERSGYTTDIIADHAIEWLRRRPASKPFFLYVPFTAPHSPFQGPDDGPMKSGGEEAWNQGQRSTYAKMVEHMDRRIGDLLAAIPENTLLIFKSDNGGANLSRNYPLRAGKSTCFEGGIRVPLMMRYPGVIPEKSSTDQVALSMDVTASILAAAQVRPSRQLDGVDPMPVIMGRQPPFSRTVFWRYKRGAARRAAVRDGDMKLVVDNGKFSLHNLAWDEAEKVNLAENEPAMVAKLREKLESWEREVRSPRLRGFSARG